MNTLVASYQAIDFDYPQPDDALLSELTSLAKIITIPAAPNVKLFNCYYKEQYAGTLDTLYARQAVVSRIMQMAKQLAPAAGLIIYDSFRTRRTQQALFTTFMQNIKQQYQLNDEASETMARQFIYQSQASDDIPPHNTGGAIDLAIYDVNSGQPWDFGCEFDATVAHAATAYFEQDYDANLNIEPQRWQTIRNNRRYLYHLMIEHDFTNFENEWWHFDLGDCLWAKHKKTDIIYDSAEAEVLALASAEQ